MKIKFTILFLLGIVLTLNGQPPDWVWAVDLGSGNNEEVIDIAIDTSSSGNDIVVVGYWTTGGLQTDLGAGSGSQNFTTTYGGEDGFVAKFNSSGDLIWAFKIGSTANDRINGVSISPTGDIYITGTFSRNALANITMDGITGTKTLNGDDNLYDMFVAKYDTDGGLQWAHRGYATTANNRYVGGQDIVAYSGGAFVAGYYNDDSRFEGTSGNINLPDDGEYSQPVILSYDSDGNLDWAAYCNINNTAYFTEAANPLGRDEESFTCIATDGNQVYVAGHFRANQTGTGSNPDGRVTLHADDGTTLRTFNGTDQNEFDIFFISFDVDGSYNWMETIESTENDKVFGMAIDADSLYLTGVIEDNADFPGPYAGNSVGTDGNGTDIFVSSHGRDDGSTGWVKRFGGQGNDNDEYGKAVALDYFGNIFMAGYFAAGSLNINGDTTINDVTGTDMFFAAYTGNGEFMYARTIGSATPFSIACDSSIYVGASNTIDLDFNGDGTVTTTNAGGRDGFIAKTGPPIGGSALSSIFVAEDTVCENGTVDITLQEYSGKIQWQSSPYGTDTWTDIPGETSRDLAVTITDSTDYRAVLTNNFYPNDTSRVATVYTTPEPTANISGTTAICNGESTNLTATFTGLPNFNFTWSDGITPTTVNNVTSPHVFSVSPTANTTYTITNVELASVTGCSDAGTGSAVITVYALPTKYNLSGSGNICPEGGSRTLALSNSQTNVTYKLIKQSDGTTHDTEAGTGAAINFTATDTGAYYCIAENDITTCVNTMNNIVTIGYYAVFNATTSVTEDTICSGSSTSLSCTGGVSYNWSPSATLSNATASNPTATPVNTTNYMVTATNSNGCTDKDTVTVTVLIAPNANAGINKSFCQGDSVQLSGTFDADYSYSWSPAGGLSNATIHNPYAKPSATTDYILTVENSDGCTDKDTVTVTVRTVPSVNAGDDTTICKGSTANLLATAAGGSGFSYNWNPGVNAASNPVSPITNTTYIVTVENSDNCEDTDTVVVSVNNTPVVSAGNDTNVCPGEVSSLIAVIVTGTTGNYTYGWTDGTNNYSGDALEVTVTSDKTFILSVEDDNGCAGTDSKDVFVFPAVLANAGNDTAICYGESVILNASGGTNYTWSPATGLSATNISNPTANPTATRNYTLTVTDVNGCTGTDAIQVIVNNKPTAQINSLNSSYCSNSAVDAINATPVPAGIATGVFSTTITGFTDNGNGTASLNPSLATLGGPYNVIYTFTDTNGCVDKDTNQVTIYQAPTATISGSSTICEGNDTTFRVLFNTSANYYVEYSDGSTINNFTSASGIDTFITVSPVVNTSYTLVSVTNLTTNCSGTVAGSAVISVTPAVEITTQPTNESDCPGTTVSFNVVSDGVNLSYAWQFDQSGAPVNYVATGSNSASLPINNITSANAGNYRVIVASSTCGSPDTSDVVTLAVGNTTTITSNPSDVVACDGTAQSFQVVATGDALTYQWRENGVDILPADPDYSGENNATLIASNLDNTFNGNIYTCVVSGTCGSKTSNPATLTVNDPTVITVQPTNKNACPGSNVNYTLTATGTDLDYQWQQDTGTGYYDIALAINSNYIITNVDSVDAARTYRCLVYSPCGDTAISDEVNLTLYTEIDITSNPLTDTVCTGSVANFQVGATGSNRSFQWRLNGANLVNGGSVSGADLANLTIDPVAAIDDGFYDCVVSNVCGSVPSNPAELEVDAAITINSQPSGVNACPGSNVSFTITTTSGTNLIYQWQKGGVNLSNGGSISGVQTNTLVINNISSANAGNYRCVISNSCGNTTSNVAVLTVYTSTTITAQPTGDTACVGDNAAFSITATGSNLTYQWYLGTNPIAGATSTVYNITGVAAVNAGNYTCQVTGSCGSPVSNVANLLVNQVVAITSSPQSDTVCPTAPKSLTVVATGTNRSYQWKFDNGGGYVNIGTNNPVYTIASFGAANVGSYYCVVTNSCGSENSDVAVLTMGTTTSITSQPVGDTLCEGSDASFSVTATGTGLTYQWRLEDVDLVEGGDIIGSTTSTLSVSNISATDEGVYTCVVTGACGSINTSTGANLDVLSGITVSPGFPTSKSRCLGTNTSFTVNASGYNIKYQWYKDGVLLPNDTNATKVISTITLAHAGNYYCRITNSCDMVNSNTANLNVLSPISIVSNPSNASECEDASTSFTVTASGSNQMFQWYKDGVALVNGTRISGATTNTLDVDTLALADAGNYSCNVYNTCNSLTSGAAILTVDENVNITAHPTSSQFACIDENINLQVTATGTDLHYRWFFNDGGGFDTVGVDNYVHAIDSFASIDAGTYYCEVYNGCISKNSNNAIVNKGTPTGIVSNPVADTLCVGGNKTFTVVADGSDLTYQWKKDGADLANGGRFSGCNSQQLIITGLLVSDFGTYSCEVTGSCGTVQSLGANLTVDEAITISSQPASDTVCIGDNASFTVIASGTNLNYSWQKDGSPIIPAETNPSYLIDTVALSDIGLYRCIISNGCEEIYTSTANLLVETPLTITSQPQNITDCEDFNASFSLNYSGSNPSFQWYKNSTALVNILPDTLTDVRSKDLNIGYLVPGDAGNYYCTVSNSCGTLTSNTAVLVVDEEIDITTEPQDDASCSGGNVNLMVVSGGTQLSYQWYHDGVKVGTNDPVYTISPFAPDSAGTYFVAITNSCGTENSDSAVVTSADSTYITINPTSKSICEGNNANFVIAATGTGLTYQWYKNGSAISGAASTSYGITNIAQSDDAVYHCIASGVCNDVTSNIANLNVLDSTKITVQPVGYTVLEGNDANMSIVATGDTLTYQWRKGGVNLTDGADYSGTQTSALTIFSTIDGVDDGIYTCIVTGECGSILSSPALLNVSTTTIITTQPATPIIRCEGETMNLSIQPSTGHTYQWLRGTDTLVNITDTVSGATSSSLTISNLTTNHAGAYTCIVDGLETSSPAVVTVNPKVVINTQPISKTVCYGTTTVFTVVASGSILSYQWKLNGNNLTNITDTVSGVNSATLTLENVTDSLEGVYTCFIHGTCNDVTSSPRTLTVDKNTIINVQPVNDTICEGTSTTFNVDVTGDNITYQWKKNALNIGDTGAFSGTTTDELIITNAQETDAGTYTLDIIGSCGTVTSNSVQLLVRPTTSVTLQPSHQTKCNGDNVVFTVNAEGTSNSYQWRRNGNPLVDGGDITGSLTPSLTINHLTDSYEGTITCSVTGLCNSTTSDPAVLTVNTVTDITTQPVGDTICEGSSTSIEVVAAGDNLTYQWTKDNVNISDTGTYSGTTSNELVISNALETDEGIYRVNITGLCGNENSNPADLTVYPTTIITSQPSSQTRCNGETAVFTIVSEGQIISYQWRRNGVALTNGGNISGANLASLTITNVTDANEGTYTCFIDGACNDATSSQAVLTVNNPTNIIAHPVDLTLCQGNTANFSVSATGDGLSYQWVKDGSALSNGGTISGATDSVLLITNVSTLNSGIYSCNITGACTDFNSNQATLTVNATTSITTQPTSKTKCTGDNAVLTVVAKGSNTYQWRRNGINLVEGGDISGSTFASVTINNLTTANSGTYTCFIDGVCNDLTTTQAILTVSDPTAITLQPFGDTICEGTSITLNVNAGGGNLSYQWKKNSVNLSDTGSYSGSGSNSLVISNSLETDAGVYTCYITGACGDEYSNSATLGVNPTTVITKHPTDKSRCEGDNTSFSVISEGNNLTYQWQLDNVDLPGATNSLLNLTGISSGNVGAYTCIVNGTCGTETSDPAYLTVVDYTNIITEPFDDTVCEGGSISFIVEAVGSNLTYQWIQNGTTNLTDGGNISGVKTSELSIVDNDASDIAYYSCKVTGLCGNRTSNSALLTVKDSVQIISNPINQTIVEGNNASFSVSATGIITSYQWQKNGVNLIDGGNISGSATALLTISNVVTLNAGSYRCIISGECGTINSSPANLTVYIPTDITVVDSSKTKCAGLPVSFSITAVGTNIKYQWQFNGNNLSDGPTISGTKSYNLSISAVDSSHEGNYTCLVTGDFGSENSNIMKLTVIERVKITQHPASADKCNGDALFLSVNSKGENLTYQWKIDTTNLLNGGGISGAQSKNFLISSIDSTNSGTYRCLVSNTCGWELSNPAIINIGTSVSITTQPVNATRCEGQSVSFLVEATGDGLTYQWYKNNLLLSDSTRISGTSSNNLVINNLQLSDAGIYSCFVDGDCSSENSSFATLVVNKRTVISTHPSDLEKCENGQASFEVVAAGENITYQWQKDGVNITSNPDIAGINSSVLIINNLDASDEGTYRCVVSGTCNTITSNPAYLTLNSLVGPAGPITGLTTLCQGEKDILYQVDTIANASSYVWTLPYGAELVNSGTSSFIRVNYNSSSLSGAVTVSGKNSCGLGASSSLAVTINAVPTANAGTDEKVCKDNYQFKANITTNGIWSLVSGQAIFADSSVYNTTVTGLEKGANVFAWRVSENGCTAYDTVIITNNLQIVSAGPDQILCVDSTQLSGNTPAKGTGKWSIIKGSAYFTNSAVGTTKVYSLDNDTNVLRWSIVYENCSSYDDVNIINFSPGYVDAGPNQNIESDQAILNAVVPSIGTGTWTRLSGGGTIVDPSLPNSSVIDLFPGKNVFEWVVSNESCFESDTVEILSSINALRDAGNDTTICVNSIYLNAEEPLQGTTGEWSVFSGSATFVDKTNAKTLVRNLGSGKNTFIWTINANGAIFEDDVNVTNNAPTIANAGSDRQFCIDSVFLNANTPSIGTGVWSIITGSGVLTDSTRGNTLIRNLGKGTNILRWKITNLTCSSQDDVTITNNMPTTADAGDSLILCESFTTLYGNAPVFGTGLWTLKSGSNSVTFDDQTAGNTTVYNLGQGSNTLRWTITNSNCISSDDVIIVNNLPNIAQSGYNQSICVDSFTLSGNAPRLVDSAIWTVRSGYADIVDPTASNTKIRNLAKGNNILRWTLTHEGCVSYDEVEIAYDLIEANAGIDQALCSEEFYMSASDPGVGTGSWSIVAGGGSFDNSASSNTKITSVTQGTNILRWTIVNKECTSTDMVTITNNNPDDAYAGADINLCKDNTTLKGNKPIIGTGAWNVLKGSAQFEDSTMNNTKVTNLGLGANILQWVLTYDVCTSTDEVYVYNNLPDPPDAGDSATICVDSTVLSASSPLPGTGRWNIVTGSGTFVNSQSPNTKITNLGRGSNILRWTVSEGDCYAYDDVVINVDKPNTPRAGSDQTVCTDSTTLYGNNPGTHTGHWEKVQGNGIIRNPNSYITVVTGLHNEEENVFRWVIEHNECSLSDEIKIISNKPTTADAGGDTIYLCHQDSTRLFATAPSKGTGSWSVVSGKVTILRPSEGDSKVTNVGFGPNTLRWTTNYLGCKSMDEIILQNNTPEVYVAVEDTTIYSSNFIIVGNKPSKGTGQWSPYGTNATIANPNSYQTQVSNLDENSTNTFIWTITYNGCAEQADIEITYLAMPKLEFSIIGETKGCPPLSVMFTNNSTLTQNPVTWDFGDGTTSSDPQPTHIYNQSGRYTAKLITTGPNNAQVTKDTLIEIYAMPEADFYVAPELVYIPSDQGLQCYDNSTNGNTYLWDFGDSTSVEEQNPVHFYSDTGTFDVTLHVWSVNNCYDFIAKEGLVQVLESGTIEFPSAFTPNPDGPNGGKFNENDYNNDVFHPIIKGVDEYNLEIYNRWGIMMFSSNDPKIGWDGWYKGKPAPEDVYIYRVYGVLNNGRTYDYAKDFLLIRKKK